jgi:putative ABC transport system ATP-binding protein
MIEIREASIIFNPGQVNEVRALDSVNLRIEKGEFVVLVGANGSGKTTLLNLISGSIFPTEGEIWLQGKNVTSLADYQRSRWVARVFQDPMGGTAPDLSIEDNFRLAALRTRRKGLTIGTGERFCKKIRKQIAGLGLGLEDKLQQSMGSLSGGQRQALTLLMSVMDDTEILLLDEPTAALDPKSEEVVMQTADRLIREHDLTAVLISHNLEQAQHYGSRLIQMDRGRIGRDLSYEAKQEVTVEDMFQWFR